ncbi:MAG: hypothetical protein IPP72_10070 [Chitinophagaceae bacterium]|nr:hypothetical protein [Chitinophagaceae bacterium]
MALEEFERKRMSERHRGMSQMRTISNYGGGIFIVLAGCFFMFPTSYTAEFIDRYDPVLIKIFAVVCWVYGGFRIYRGYQKKYFND